MRDIIGIKTPRRMRGWNKHQLADSQDMSPRALDAKRADGRARVRRHLHALAIAPSELEMMLGPTVDTLRRKGNHV